MLVDAPVSERAMEYIAAIALCTDSAKSAGDTVSPASTYCEAKYMTMNPRPSSIRPAPNFAAALKSRARLPSAIHSAANTGANTMMKSGFTACSQAAGMFHPKICRSV